MIRLKLKVEKLMVETTSAIPMMMRKEAFIIKNTKPIGEVYTLDKKVNYPASPACFKLIFYYITYFFLCRLSEKALMAR